MYLSGIENRFGLNNLVNTGEIAFRSFEKAFTVPSCTKWQVSCKNNLQKKRNLLPTEYFNGVKLTFKGISKYVTLDRVAEKANEVLKKATLTDEKGEFRGYMAIGSDETFSPDYKFLWTRDNMYALFYDLIKENSYKTEKYIENLAKVIDEDGLVPVSIEPETGKKIKGAGDTIGYVHSVDSTLLFLVMVSEAANKSKDPAFFDRVKEPYINALKLALENNRFDSSPLISSVECAGLVDRPLGMHGYVAGNQVLFYAALDRASKMEGKIPAELAHKAKTRADELKKLIHEYFWVDSKKLGQLEINIEKSARRDKESECHEINPFNLKKLPYHNIGNLMNGGYFLACARTGYLDFRFDTITNLMAIAFGLTDKEQADLILNYIENNGINKPLPVKYMWPAMPDDEIERLTPGDTFLAENRSVNGGIWPFVGALYSSILTKSAQRAKAEEVLNKIARVIEKDMPEWLEGTTGEFIPELSNKNQTWTAACYLLAFELLKSPERPFLNL